MVDPLKRAAVRLVGVLSVLGLLASSALAGGTIPHPNPITLDAAGRIRG
jgi:hypothetical protein